VLPEHDTEELRHTIFYLGYRQHGGSGLGLSLEACLELTWEELNWYAEKLQETRERESAALRRK
jgi:hypothetical protein